MITPEELIADLDGSLGRRGENIILRRRDATDSPAVNIDVTVRARVMAFAPNELVGTISQTDSRVILSPTQIIAAGWPTGGSASVGYEPDTRLPKTGDKAIIQGRPRTISFVKPIYDGGTLVRIELTVAG
jgi:hypothetical protein